ncbi:MAG: tetratricopeptide repeat protein [Myxococcales bacterium]|nr:tetratricopeptide repeat protein [Myxococcales bacterium]
MRIRSSATLIALVAFTITACGKKESPPPLDDVAAAPTTTAPPAAEVDAASPAPEADTAAPTEAAEADTSAPPAPVAVEGDGDWLLWQRDGAGGWLTRWVSVTGSRYEVVAERKAVVLSDGTELFRVERADREVDVKPCACFEEGEEAADCKVTGKVTRPGLRALELSGGEPLEVYPAGSDAMYGGDMDLAVDLGGGAGALLVFDWTEGGYFCGAHGAWDAGTRVFDLAKGAQADGVFAAVDEKLPAEVRAPAAEMIYPALKECEDGELTKAQAAAAMRLDGVTVSLEGGAPKLTWSYSAEVMYACSSDYAVHGQTTSGLLPAAAPLGLAGPLPGGVTKALAAGGDTSIVGFSRLTLEGAAREQALAAFKEVPETAWGPTRFADRALAGEPESGDAVAAKKLVSAARKLTASKDYAAAIAKFSEAIGLDGGVAAAWSGRGYAALLAGSLDAAKADFEKAATLDKDATFLAQVHYNLGQVAEKQKDLDTAKAEYRKSLALRPNDAVEKALARVSE